MSDNFEQVRIHLAARIARWIKDGEEYMTPISGLSLHRHTRAGAPVNCLLEPAIAMPVQGAKQTLLGSEAYSYDQHRFLITSLDLPVAMQVASASPELPYLSAVLRLDVRMISDLIMQTGMKPQKSRSISGPGMVLGSTTIGLLAAFDHLIGLLDEPELIPVLAPLAQREIFYRILCSESGGHLWQVASIENQNQSIGRAIDWLKTNFREPLRVEELAAHVNMSISRFHHHFRRLTSMSPLQFQKWLRLTEARRLMLVQGVDAATAAYDVGYESPSQFSREYARQFGTSPRRDVEDLLRQTILPVD
ncbi:AraC family transcriptional regulator N-terminal domain-containing protein [Ralstonia pseudosolanacearum]|uniref:AraC family transcriptional regulator n=1 Tax=Ralstonia pseudosolanacearum TaxID=1310165 RepID=UPI003CFE52D4